MTEKADEIIALLRELVAASKESLSRYDQAMAFQERQQKAARKARIIIFFIIAFGVAFYFGKR